jgi:hypothetical protein
VETGCPSENATNAKKAGACSVSTETEHALRHDPEKWIPVFGKDHAQTRSWSAMTIRRKVIPL